MSPRAALGVAARRVTGRPEPTVRPRPGLRVVPPPASRAPRTPFVVLVLLLLGAGLVGLLLLNTSLQQGAFDLHDLERSTAELRDRRQALASEVAEREAPAALARRAASLGMVPNPQPAFLRLADGSILGELEPAEGEDDE